MSAPTETSDVKTATQPATEDVCGAQAAPTSDTVCKHPAFGAHTKSAFEIALEKGNYKLPNFSFATVDHENLLKVVYEQFDTVVKDSGLSEREFDDKTHQVLWGVQFLSPANPLHRDSVTHQPMLDCETHITGFVQEKLTNAPTGPFLNKVVLRTAIPAKPLSYEEATETNVRSAFESTERPPPERETEKLIASVITQVLEDRSQVEKRLGDAVASIPKESKWLAPSFDLGFTDNTLDVYCLCDVHSLDNSNQRISVLPVSVRTYFSVKKTSEGKWGVFDHELKVAATID